MSKVDRTKPTVEETESALAELGTALKRRSVSKRTSRFALTAALADPVLRAEPLGEFYDTCPPVIEHAADRARVRAAEREIRRLARKL